MNNGYLAYYNPPIAMTFDEAFPTPRQFAELDEYSCSMPTDPKTGRVWKRVFSNGNSRLAVVEDCFCDGVNLCTEHRLVRWRKIRLGLVSDQGKI